MDQEQDIVGAAEVVAELAFRAAKLTEVDEGLYIGMNRDGDAKVVDVRVQIEEMLDHPKRKMAACRAYDVDSFVDYLKKHGEPDTEIWANLGMQSVMAVIDAHGGVGKPAGWATHTISLELSKSSGWRSWLANDRKFLPQSEFAEHVEERLIDFVNPTGVDMLEIAQSIKTASRGEFESTKRLKSGETAFVYRETSTATAGAKGELSIPDVFTLQLQPFEGGQAYKVEARFRYRATAQGLALGYVLTRPEDVIRDAFDGIVHQVRVEAGREVWLGKVG